MLDEKTAQSLNDLRRALDSLPAWPETEVSKEKALRKLDLLADRMAHPDRPWVVAVCGPTGAGKSHLVNYLAGGPVSPSSYRRPSTVAPVVIGPEEQLAIVRDGCFLPDYDKMDSPGGVKFSEIHSRCLYLSPPLNPAWNWPAEMILIDTPDFDSVRLENQAQSLDMARRADALIFVVHQAKYADQSPWDFLAQEAARGRPLLLVLNRVTATAALDDFKERLAKAGREDQLLPWPEEVAVGQVAVEAARRDLSSWLEKLGARGRELVAENGRQSLTALDRAINDELLPPLFRRQKELRAGLENVRQVTRAWVEEPRDRVSLNLPGETREGLLKSLSEVVSRSDLWAKPRRWLARPFEALESGFRRLTGRNEAQTSAEERLADSLASAGREALVSAVRGQGRALAEAAGLTSPQAGLDFSPEEIRELHEEMSRRLDQWLKEETSRLLAGLPLGQKAAFYFVQFMHLGLVLGVQIQTGGLPGTEVLVGGALGPVISKLTGSVISRENLAAFEERAAERHRLELADIFQRQGGRYENFLAAGLEDLGALSRVDPALDKIQKEARRLWA